MNNKQFNELRKIVTKDLRGDVLEIGFGLGLNLPYYPSGVSMLYAVVPVLLGMELAQKRIDGCNSRSSL